MNINAKMLYEKSHRKVVCHLPDTTKQGSSPCLSYICLSLT